jgi:hypothetical protein
MTNLPWLSGADVRKNNNKIRVAAVPSLAVVVR